MKPTEVPRRQTRGRKTEDRSPAAFDAADRLPSARPYHAPRLVSYGQLTRITQFGGSIPTDSGGGLGQQGQTI